MRRKPLPGKDKPKASVKQFIEWTYLNMNHRLDMLNVQILFVCITFISCNNHGIYKVISLPRNLTLPASIGPPETLEYLGASQPSTFPV